MSLLLRFCAEVFSLDVILLLPDVDVNEVLVFPWSPVCLLVKGLLIRTGLAWEFLALRLSLSHLERRSVKDKVN